MSNDFSRFRLNEHTVRKLSEQGIESLLPVQEKAIPPAMEGKNLLVQSPAGSGKTLAYLVPLLALIREDQAELQALIILPTRELASQVNGVLGQVKPEGLKHGLFIEGTSRKRQKEKLKEKPAVIVGTPASLLQILSEGKVKTGQVQMVVVDEADRLFDEKYYSGVKGLLNQLPATGQYLFVSAASSPPAEEIFREFSLPYEKVATEKNRISKAVGHWFIMAGESKKFPALKALEKTCGIDRSIIFIRKNSGVKGLARRLKEHGFNAEGLHSEMPAQERKRIMQLFRSGKIKYLVTTDILARGMDIPDVYYIINYDLPDDHSTYAHRAGRTGRAGKKGIAITFVEERKKFVIKKYERKLGIRFREKGLSRDGRLIDVSY